jgi:N-acetyl-anhydromuramyl-L-alanine amidase AmpD
MRIPGIPYVQGRNSYRDADDRKFGIAIHATANTASDTNEAAYATRRPDGTSTHLYVDGDSVTQSLDTTAKAGHAGSGNGNENAYAIEITGLTAWTREQWIARVAWAELGRCLAWLIRNDPDLAGFEVRRAGIAEMRSNPKIKAFYGHNDMRLAWGGTDHTDPGPNFPWERLLQAVNAALDGAPTTPEGPDMQVITIARSATGQLYKSTGTESWPITEADLADINHLSREGRWALCWDAKGVGHPRSGWYPAAFGEVQETQAERAMRAQREVDTLAAAQQTLAAIRAAGGDPSALDQAAIIAHINRRADEVRVLLEEGEAERRVLRERLADALLRAQ